MDDDNLLDELLNSKFTFSPYCRKGHVKKCGCWKCREFRGEEFSEETEEIARQQAEEVDKKIGYWFEEREDDEDKK